MKLHNAVSFFGEESQKARVIEGDKASPDISTPLLPVKKTFKRKKHDTQRQSPMVFERASQEQDEILDIAKNKIYRT